MPDASFNAVRCRSRIRPNEIDPAKITPDTVAYMAAIFNAENFEPQKADMRTIEITTAGKSVCSATMALDVPTIGMAVH